LKGRGSSAILKKTVLFKEGVLLFGVSALVPGWLTFKGTGAFLFPQRGKRRFCKNLSRGFCLILTEPRIQYDGVFVKLKKQKPSIMKPLCHECLG